MANALTSHIDWSIVDSPDEGTVFLSMDGAVEHINQTARSIFRLSTSGQHNGELSLATLFEDADLRSQLLNPPTSVVWQANDNKFQVRTTAVSVEKAPLIKLSIWPTAETSIKSALQPLDVLTRINLEPDFDQQLTMLVNGLQSIGWKRVSLSLRNESFLPTKLVTAGFSPAEIETLNKNMVSPQVWIDLFENESLHQYRHGLCYFIPGDSEWIQTVDEKILVDETAVSTDEQAWHPKDILCAVLLNRQNKRIGMIGLDQPVNGLRPTHQTLQTVALYAQFASSIIENKHLVDESLDRQKELETLFDASQALSRTLDRYEVLTILGQHMLQAINATGYLIYEWNEPKQQITVLQEFAMQAIGKNPSLVGTAVSVQGNNQIQTILLQQQPEIIPVKNLDGLPIPTWVATPNQFTCALMPLVQGEETFGLIQLFKADDKRPLGRREMQLLFAIANQASSALETILIFEDTYEREQFYNALGYVNLAINDTLDKNTVLDLICSEAIRVFNVDGAYIWQLENNQFVGSAAKGPYAQTFLNATVPLKQTDSFVYHLRERGVASYLNQVPQQTSYQLNLPHSEEICAALGVPLAKEGETIGLLILTDTKNLLRFDDKDVSWASLFGIQVSIALQNANLFDELVTLNEELDARVAERTQALNAQNDRVNILLRINTELSSSLDQDRVLNQALELVNDVVDASQGVILLIDQPTGELIFRASLGEQSIPISPKGVSSGLYQDQGLAGWIIQNRSAVIVHDTREDARWIDLPRSRMHRSVLGVPLISNEEVIGVLMLFHANPSSFTLQQLDLVEAAAVQVANAINNANLYQLIFEQADQLGSTLRNEIIQRANLEAILESIADGVIVADAKNNIDIVNVSAANILDISREQLLGRSLNEFLGLYGSFQTSWFETIENWYRNSDRIKTGTVLAGSLQIEDRVISVKLSPVISDSQFYGTVSIFRDITKEVEVDRLKSEFVSTVSHELRTPMTSIKGYADLMLMGAAGQMSSPQTQYLQVIKSNADRLHMLVNDLLNISRIETGKTKLDLRPLDVPQLVNQIVNGHLNGRIQHEKKQLTIHKQFSQELPLVTADQVRVTQILTNLLDNAFNYTPSGGTITITAVSGDRHVYISVEDDGIGISEANQKKIFDRFYRAEDEEVQKVSGTGLGLSIVNSLVEMHGGKLTVSSKLSEGSKFTFNLPIVIEDEDLALEQMNNRSPDDPDFR